VTIQAIKQLRYVLHIYIRWTYLYRSLYEELSYNMKKNQAVETCCICEYGLYADKAGYNLYSTLDGWMEIIQ